MGARDMAARRAAISLTAIAFIAAGALVGEWTHDHGHGARVWLAGLLLTGVPMAWRTLRHALSGHLATDVVATLAVLTAIALAQPLAGLIVVLMQTGGEALERFAEGRASDAVRALEDAAPHVAHRVRGGRVDDVAVADVGIGETLLVRPGEPVPCDAEVIEGRSDVDASRLTGEPLPIRAVSGVRLLSGSLNQYGALTVRTLARAADSQYERIVELVRTAQATKSPLQRLADRYAIWFTPITLAVCAIAFAATRDWGRVLAVLVVATPCPLILATPIAIIGGINRAARRQIIVRTGAALEQLGAVTTVVFDKTGTLTVGRPLVRELRAAPGFDRDGVLRFAGALEQHSSHPLARTVVDAAEAVAAPLPPATNVTEFPGRGVEGTVDGRIVTVGARSLVTERQPGAARQFAALDGSRAALTAYVAVDGQAAAIIEYADQIRPGAATTLDGLRRMGIVRQMLLTGDHAASARAVAAATGIREAWGDLTAEGKVRIVRDALSSGERVMMVGDGTNDAPALSAATVGIALAAHGGGITAESADAVILNDDLTRVVDAIRISRHTMWIARQSIWIGLGLSGVAMVVAALGHIPPTVGALLQEGIDVAVILNALRTSWDKSPESRASTGPAVRATSEPCQGPCPTPGPAVTY